LALPSQLGGAAGTLAAATELAGPAGLADPAKAALEVAARTSATLGLAARPPWHTARAPVTRIGDALAGCTGAWGRIANDVLTGSRPEIGELAEPAAAGRGGSSALPQKVNPVLSVLVRRAALTAPAYAAQLHLAAADAADERPAGAWHTEWQALQLLGRHAVTAAAQTTELLAGLVVHADRMGATLAAAGPGLTAEQRSLGPGDGPYLGASDLLVAAALDRARAWLG
jgi:3-carboxy-cis,cis-muconate cycloisomerase